MSRTLRPAAATAVAILAIAIAAVLVLRLAGAPIALGPAANPSPTVAATATPTGIPVPTPSPEVETSEALALIERQVQDLRDLPAPDIGPPEVITRAELADELEVIVNEGWTPDELRRANLLLQALGLLTADQDLAELSRQLLEGQVIGFYEPIRKRMVVVSDAGLDATARVTYAHEYTHALQDAAFDAFARQDQLTDDDPILAGQALTEGDATLLMFQWAVANLGADELGQIGSTPLPDTTGIPDWMIRQLEWPYLAGLNFLASVSGMSIVPGSGTGSWRAVDDIYADPPTTTEQVIHPEKYVEREAPLPVAAPALGEALGAGWEELAPDTLGEAMISIWLAELGAGTSADQAAAGWGGDRLTVAAGPDGTWALAWRIAWDTTADAQEFVAAEGQLALPGDAGTTLLRTASDETLLLRASSSATLETLRAALGGF